MTRRLTIRIWLAIALWAALGLMALATGQTTTAVGPKPTAKTPPGVDRVLCDWTHPGADPYRGSRWDAVMRRDGIALAVRLRLAWRLWKGTPPDAQAIITRDGIASATPGIDLPPDGQPWDLNFGAGRTCRLVLRDGWAADHTELADLWCTATHCEGIVRTCGNHFWVERLSPALMTTRTAAQIAQQQGPAHRVDEPGSLGLMLLAGAVAGWLRWIRG